MLTVTATVVEWNSLARSLHTSSPEYDALYHPLLEVLEMVVGAVYDTEAALDILLNGMGYGGKFARRELYRREVSCCRCSNNLLNCDTFKSERVVPLASGGVANLDDEQHRACAHPCFFFFFLTRLQVPQLSVVSLTSPGPAVGAVEQQPVSVVRCRRRCHPISTLPECRAEHRHYAKPAPVG